MAPAAGTAANTKHASDMAPATGTSTTTKHASAAPKKPKGATGLCEDGTYTTSKNKQGACSSHGGLKEWLKK